MHCGLYEVVPDSIYQVRGGDMANVTFLEDPTQASRDIVVVDPLQNTETAVSALEMYLAERGPRTIVAVIYAHSHADHYGGARALFTATDGVPDLSVKIYAPDEFLEHAVSENVYAGNAMTRRALFMYGSILHRGQQGQVDAGLGKTMATGTVGLLPPDRHRPRRPRHPHRPEPHRVPAHSWHRGAGRDELLPARLRGAVHGRERHPDPAQPLQPARRPGPRRQELVQLPQRRRRAVRPRGRGAVRQPLLAPLARTTQARHPDRRLSSPARPTCTASCTTRACAWPTTAAPCSRSPKTSTGNCRHPCSAHAA
ncbi:MBL fold metallo-hydrolase [Nonomuraea sp. MTCD27]|uniref:MBL fold metallo-hydrolase n=1 Tax=Nonomuraea sp. MTCD27 TaxID=1676747 RepID=UPI0035C0DBDC